QSPYQSLPFLKHRFEQKSFSSTSSSSHQSRVIILPQKSHWRISTATSIGSTALFTGTTSLFSNSKFFQLFLIFFMVFLKPLYLKKMVLHSKKKITCLFLSFRPFLFRSFFILAKVPDNNASVALNLQ